MPVTPAGTTVTETPAGPWVMVQRWHDLLFAHWRCAITDLRPLVPQPLEIDTFDGTAWIMRMTKSGEVVSYESERWAWTGRPAGFTATYQPAGPAAHAAPGSLDHFLTERYALYAADEKRIWRGDIVHPPWNLQPAKARIERNSMVAAAGIRQPGHDPLLHFSAFQDVRLWWPVRVR